MTPVALSVSVIRGGGRAEDSRAKNATITKAITKRRPALPSGMPPPPTDEVGSPQTHRPTRWATLGAACIPLGPIPGGLLNLLKPGRATLADFTGRKRDLPRVFTDVTLDFESTSPGLRHDVLQASYVPACHTQDERRHWRWATVAGLGE